LVIVIDESAINDGSVIGFDNVVETRTVRELGGEEGDICLCEGDERDKEED